MYHVLIFCGGTGSIALQNGLGKVFGVDRIKIDIVINAYDNGKSTGECRKLFDYAILGPSDLRKNQLTQYTVRFSKELEDVTSQHSRLLQLFEIRMTTKTYDEYFKMGTQLLCEADFLEEEQKKYLQKLLEFFFFENMEKGIWRQKVKSISFKDFSLSNIFYASCAAMNQGSLAFAGCKMAEILGIPDNIHLISHTPLLLQAYTESGVLIKDEAEIVAWNNASDRIASVTLKDTDGKDVIPAVDEGILQIFEKVSALIGEADIIIFSSGTQWSSLIPIYMHKNFRELIEDSSAAKYLIMNNIEDADMLGVSSAEICERIAGYFDLSDVKILLNNGAASLMQEEVPNLKYIHADLGEGKNHNPEKLVEVIFEDFFMESLFMSKVMYDLDGTLWNGRGSELEMEVGAENLNLFDGIIVSGNSYEHIRDTLLKYKEECRNPVQVFCNYGNTQFSTDMPDVVSSLSEEYWIDQTFVEMISTVPRYMGMVQERGNVIITIKPLENREKELEYLEGLMVEWKGEYKANIAGNTSIDITKRNYNKAGMILRIIDLLGIDMDNLLFVGNELYEGSETEINNIGIQTLNVRDVFECNVFLRMWNRVKKRK